ncbi:tyrosine-type recombinase/integrase [Gemmatimonas sp.]|uniref:tyrosine-type recombinase/integrase n=1 Tax=Gemmatimonas sp. TaxID=1962908 RepID=UPI003341F471
MPPGEEFATTDPVVAQTLFDARWKRYERALDRDGAGLPAAVADHRGPTLATFAKTFLETLAGEHFADGQPAHKPRDLDRRKRGILACLETLRLRRVHYLSRLEPQDVDAMLVELRGKRKADGKPLSAATVRSYSMEFSAMLSFAVSTRVLTFNPLPSSRKLPRSARRTALEDDAYLTRAELKALLEHVLPSPQVPYAIELVMTLVYTGMRREEALGLLVRDVDFDAQEIRVAPNTFRDGKSEAAERKIPLWPKLAAVLKAFIGTRPGHAPLFPSVIRKAKDKIDAPIKAILGTLRAAARRAGIQKSMDHHILRHSYVSARLHMYQLSVTGVQVKVDAQLIVSEIGHSDETLIRRVYGHLTRERINQVLLEFGEKLPDARTARQRRSAYHSERVRAGRATQQARRAAGEADATAPSTPLSDAEQAQRRGYARTIRETARSRGWCEMTLTTKLTATPAEVTAIMRGDLSRLPLARMQRYAAAVARMD